MTKNRAKKNAIRARKGKTGERYTTARLHVAPPVDDVLIHPPSAGFAFRVARGPQPSQVIITHYSLSIDRPKQIKSEREMSVSGRHAVALRNAVNAFFENSAAPRVIESEVLDHVPDAAYGARSFEELVRATGPNVGIIHEPGSSFAIAFGRGRTMAAPNPSGTIYTFTFSERGQLLSSATMLIGNSARDFRDAVNAFVPAPRRAPTPAGVDEPIDDWGRTLDETWHLVAVPHSSPLSYVCGVHDPYVREFVGMPNGVPPPEKAVCMQCITMRPSPLLRTEPASVRDTRA
jgi:hypothetical protein